MRASRVAALFVWTTLVGYTSSSSAQNFEVQSIIPVGSSPRSAAVSHDGSRLFIGNYGSGNISVVAAQNGELLKTILVGSSPHGLLLSHDGQRLYVLVNLDGSDDCNSADTEDEIHMNVVVIDTGTLTVVQTIPLRGRTDALALTPDDKRLYIARVCHEVDYLDLPSEELHASLETKKNSGGLPVGLLISPDGSRMFVNYQGGGPYYQGLDGYTNAHDALVEYDMTTGDIVRLEKSLPNVGDQIVLSPDGTQLWSNGADACSRPDYPHAGCPSVPSKVVSALRVSGNPQTTLTPLKTFGLSLLEFNGRISISSQGDVFVGGGVFLKRIDPRSLLVVQRLEIAGAGDVVFSPDGQTAYVTVSEKNEVDVLARGKPANPAVQSEVAALPISIVDSVLLNRNCVQDKLCEVCANSGNTCSAEGTPSQLQAPILSEVLSSRGSVSGPGGPVVRMKKGEDLPCSLAFEHEQLSDAEALRLLVMTNRRDGNNVFAFEGKDSKSKDGVQFITAPTGDAPTLVGFKNGLGEETVYLTTIICHNRVETALFRLGEVPIVVTAKHDDGKTPFTQKEVEDLAGKFQEKLTDPCSSLDDIKKTGLALYNIIFPPDILAAIRKREPDTLAWGLSDELRYIPMGALWDGNEFLLEKYGNSLRTPNSTSSADSQDAFIALAAGDSNQQGSKSNELSYLASVHNEITETFTPASLTENDKIPAIILLDHRDDETLSEPASYEAFSAANLKEQLPALKEIQRRRRIVHLASHFVLKHTARDSYLLTESGPLSFSDLSDKSKFDFERIWLVTLSACETGVGVSASDGSEVQSFASVADANGAMSTVASLWDVQDSSTSLLMQSFYANLLQHMGKGEALRQAQIKLLGETGPRKWERANKSTCPTQISHPYFWAPFVLIGNWN